MSVIDPPNWSCSVLVSCVTCARTSARIIPVRGLRRSCVLQLLRPAAWPRRFCGRFPAAGPVPRRGGPAGLPPRRNGGPPGALAMAPSMVPALLPSVVPRPVSGRSPADCCTRGGAEVRETVSHGAAR